MKFRLTLVLGVLFARIPVFGAEGGMMGQEAVFQARDDLSSALGSMAGARGLLQQAEDRMAEAREGLQGASNSGERGNALEAYLQAREDYQAALHGMESAAELYNRKKTQYLLLQAKFKRDHGNYLMGAGGEGTAVGFSLPAAERETKPRDLPAGVAYGRPPGYANSNKPVPVTESAIPVQKPPAHGAAEGPKSAPAPAPAQAPAAPGPSSPIPSDPIRLDAHAPSALKLPPPPTWDPAPLPNELSILIGAAESRLQAGDAQGALDYAEKAALRDRDDAASRHIAAQALLQMGFYEEAEVAAKEALKRAPKNPKVSETLAWTQLQQGKYEEAARSASRALEADPSSAGAYAARAYAREGAGDDAGKKDDIAKAAAMAPARYSAQSSSAQAGVRLFSPPPPGSRRSLPLRAVPDASFASGPAAPPRSETMREKLRSFWPLGLTLLALGAIAALWLPKRPKSRQTH